jgi:hypothetical protein
LADFYYASAASFDLLCFSFFYSALIIYITIRLNGQSPDARQSIVILVLYVCGLESKEMAVSLPVMMVMFEIIYMGWQGRGIGLGLLRRSGLWRLHAATISLTLLYIAGKLAGSHKMTANPGYLPRVSVQVLCDSWAHYLYDLFYQTIRFNRVSVIVLFGGTLALAILSRRREMRLAWCVTTICAVPFLFINPRGFFVMYVTLPGWYLYAGSVLVWIREAAGNRLARIGGAARGWGVSGAWVLFMLVAAIIVPFHGLEKSVGNTWIDGAFDQTRPVLEELASRYPIMPQGAKLLFVSDPFERDDYILYFICVLRYRDRDIRVDRVKVTPGLATEAAWREYDHVFMLSSKGLVEVDRRLELSN